MDSKKKSRSRSRDKKQSKKHHKTNKDKDQIAKSNEKISSDWNKDKIL